MFDQKQYKREMRKLHKREKWVHRPVGPCGKVQYQDRVEAVGVAATRTKSRDGEIALLRVYECPRCLTFHLTGQEKRF